MAESNTTQKRVSEHAGHELESGSVEYLEPAHSSNGGSVEDGDSNELHMPTEAVPPLDPEFNTENPECEGQFVNLSNDVYNMLFICRIGGQAFWYALYVILLKLVVFTFLTLDALDGRIMVPVPSSVKVSQFLMLPVAIAIQDDLMSTYYVICNVRYWAKIRDENPHATKRKFNLANILRAVDGHYSLLVNVLIMLSATEVLSLFLNFAALQFLQTIDNIAVKLAVDGYLSRTLQREAVNVVRAKMPRQRLRGLFLYLDSALFAASLVVLVVLWGVVNFHSS